MIINFKEIPQANIANGNQDKFELFARDFLEMLGYEIIENPNRGADEKKDLVVRETLKGIEGKDTIKWLVSCKHYAHSGKSVRDVEESDISDRVKNHKCDGFMCFYSTLPQSTLNKKLNNFKSDFKIEIFDCEKIESRIIGNLKMENIFLRYFPKSYENYKKINEQKKENKRENQNIIIETKNNNNSEKTNISSEVMNALILFDLEKLKFKFYNNNWDKREEIFSEIYIYRNYITNQILLEIFDFLEDISNLTRANAQKNMVSSLFSAILEFFPTNQINDNIELAKKTVNIGFNIVYDALIHLRNLEIAMYGLTIIKYMYQNAKRIDNETIKHKIVNIYFEIESMLNRPERNDLEDGKKLVQIFKEDLDIHGLSFPILPEYIMNKIYK